MVTEYLNQNRTMSSNLVPQILPNFVTQRALYEARERPAKTYSWQIFMLSNILVELPWNTFMAVLVFICWYYPVGLYRNAQPTQAVAERGGAMFLLYDVDEHVCEYECCSGRVGRDGGELC
jgi:ATP-binding cassette subfamily G (WHITE) protein 2 (PDR)